MENQSYYNYYNSSQENGTENYQQYYQYYQYYQQFGQQDGTIGNEQPTDPYYAQVPLSSVPLSSVPTSTPHVPDGTNCKSLYVGNISPMVSEGLLYEIFSAIGAVESCKLIKDKTTGQCAGYGFVDFIDHNSANLAMEKFNGRQIYGLELKVKWAASMTSITGSPNRSEKQTSREEVIPGN